MSEVVKLDAGRKKRLQAYKGQISKLPPITHVAVGDGGEDAGGSLKIPTSDRTTLYNEIYRTTVSYEDVDDFTSKFVILLDSSSNPQLVGKKINELALVDSEGTLITMETFSLFGSGGFPQNSTSKIKTQLTVE